MTTTLAEPARAPAAAPVIPWIIDAVLFASTSVVVGVLWDISWHRTIGRDTFWTPAHLAIYLGGIVAGLVCGWLVLRTTFAGTPEERAAGVSFWGFRGPLGAWVCIWGSIAMITSAPFDNWWHNAYGLDVEILSPPHVVLALGILAIQLGAMLMVLARQNARPDGGHALGWLLAYASGILVAMVAVMATEYIAMPNRWHGATAYQVSAGIFPLFLLAVARAGTLTYPATAAAAGYMAINLAMNWILPLFPAQPMLAPILNPVDRMVPYPFPIPLVIPALGLDLLMRRLRGRNDWLQAVLLGAGFLVILFPLQWFFAEFMLSPGARNWFFTADRWDYGNRLGPWRYQFWDADENPITIRALAFALAVAATSARVGLWWGKWMALVRR